MKIYGALTSVAYALAFPYLRGRYKTGFDERRGIYASAGASEKTQKFKNPLWVHAVSVGEVQAAVPFISEIKKILPDMPVMLSTTTPTGAKMAQSMGALCDAHIYYPWDTPQIINRALDALAPRAFVAVESEIWPLFLTELKKRNIPAFLINGRISDRSFRRIKFFAPLSRAMARIISNFERLMVREQTDAERLREIGVDARKIIITGDCKIDAMMERAKNASLPEQMASDALFVAGSTHAGEDEQILEAFGIVKNKIPSARLIIVPRHPERAKSVAQMAGASDADVVVVDKIGVLFGLYSLATAAFVGGSLVPRGGQNLMEPAMFFVPTCHGKYMDDFRAVADEFDSLGISQEVNSSAEIADFWIKSARRENNTAREAAKKWFDERAGAAKKNAAIVAEFIGHGALRLPLPPTPSP